MQGCEHFHVSHGRPNRTNAGRQTLLRQGDETFWGPGRHIFGSNWFWYFNSPVGCHVEFDADMDLHDDDWVAREAEIGADTSQIFLFSLRDNWAPSGGPPPKS